MKEGELVKSSQQADDAYQYNSGPIAIFALSNYLDKLEDAKELGPTPFTDQQDISLGLVMSHGRLAQLYDMGGQTIRLSKRRPKRSNMPEIQASFHG